MLKVFSFGTRGSIPVAHPSKVCYGGNTTSFRVESDRLPPDTWLVVDMGSGFVPLSFEALKAGVKNLIVLNTHYHLDHIIGVTLAPMTFIKSVAFHLYGPVQNGVGPQEMMTYIMQQPFFPVDYAEVSSHFHCHKITYPRETILLIHPQGGVKQMQIDEFERLLNQGKKLPFGKQAHYSLNECLLIRMHNTDHPERTISFRFEDRPSSRVLCILTDHESQRAIPQSLIRHLKDADLLIQDVQYDPGTYRSRTAGFGHGTPDYAVELANVCGIKRLGFTHHDPQASDEQVGKIVDLGREFAQTAITALSKGENSLSALIQPENIFACADYESYEV